MNSSYPFCINFLFTALTKFHRPNILNNTTLSLYGSVVNVPPGSHLSKMRGQAGLHSFREGFWKNLFPWPFQPLEPPTFLGSRSSSPFSKISNVVSFCIFHYHKFLRFSLLPPFSTCKDRTIALGVPAYSRVIYFKISWLAILIPSSTLILLCCTHRF